MLREPLDLSPAPSAVVFSARDFAELGESACHSVHFSTAMLREMERFAGMLGRDLSWCVRAAWSIACGDIADKSAAVSGERMLKGRKHATLIDLPLSTWLHVALEAERLDRSRSWLLQRAWLIARPRLSKLSK